MKRFALAAIAAVTLSGCLSFPTTPEELRSHSGVRTETIEVNRSASAAMSTISNRGRSCLNFGSQTQITRGMTMNAIFTDNYRTRREGNSFIVEHMSPNNVGDPGWYPRVLADVVATGSGARVTTYAPIGDGVFTRAIQAWARGDTTPCPRNDLF
ncbi:hypothetical protein [Yoonia litorea]|uniref:Uncharacterized protein n=1 Tax=Yoonia litorea TaxID=1123755 RepID=A0A1I6MZC6_9RHOB|nr:hypothetical protein [Yoonia litorea]SFS21034.1 hypothetical protein SAMN05444714_2721 [Yoonia litorea]